MDWGADLLVGGGIACALGAIWRDWRERRVPHWTVAGLLALWLILAVAAPERLGFDPWVGLACGGAALALGMLCYAAGWWGAGDAKLLAVLALWMGPHDLPAALVGATGVGLLLLAAALAVPTGDFRTRGLPFAVALAVPAAAVLAARATGFAELPS